ncbi:unnamed protein product [Rhizophagus irregularis]|nr:unnamed protein product [Rhizophagus irregularis]
MSENKDVRTAPHPLQFRLMTSAHMLTYYMTDGIANGKKMLYPNDWVLIIRNLILPVLKAQLYIMLISKCIVNGWTPSLLHVVKMLTQRKRRKYDFIGHADEPFMPKNTIALIQ